ncbi:hypothetical protein [Mycolicibacterium iranicum]|uniref:hypothetical protein n=1 Tax=Mycolicibacterium iranicum TaxID=912594 RepID=UPI000463BDDF|nr:hypothetical protein [Mycolicibacterium iranicum]
MTLVGLVPDECWQVVVVTADAYDPEWPDGTQDDDKRPPAKLAVWYRDSDSTKKDREWLQYGNTVDAVVGWNGVGPANDDTGKTPLGSFPLGQTFGRKGRPDISFGNYFTAGPHDYWDTGWKWRQREIAGCEPLDPPSRYNHHFSAAKDPHDDNDDLETESLDQDAYNLAVLVDHNPTNRPGWGCAIFLHCDDGSRTWGCITIGEDVLSDLLPWLKTGAQPHLTVLVSPVDAPIKSPPIECPQGE